MRRPPDKDGLSERDVDSSNATLNTLFGGARQKSWMTATGAPVRPTPRTSISKASGQHATLGQKTIAAVLPSPAPSDEASPILSQTSMVNGNRRHTPNDENSRPAAASNHCSTHHQSAREAETQSQAQQRTATASWAWSSNTAQWQPLQSRTSDSVQIRDSQSPRTSFANPPLPSTVLLENSAVCGRSSEEPRSPIVAEQQSGESEQSQVHAQPQKLASGVLPQQTVGAQTQGLMAQQSQQQTTREHYHISSPSPSTASENAPLTSTMLQDQGQSRPISSSFHANPHKRQRTQVPSMPSLKPRVALIDSHIESVGGSQNLNNGLERPRFALLADACSNEDFFYVILHQLFCVYDSDRKEITNVQGLPPSSVLLVAFRILGQLIRDNEGLAPNHLKWFAQFPSSLRDLMRTSEPYRRTLNDVGYFLGKLASEWAPLSRECSSRGFPPLVDELVDRMGLLSPILQGVVFTATRRNLGIIDDTFGRQMEDLFRQDRQQHQDLAARYNTAHPPTAREVQERNRILTASYLSLHNQQRQRRLSASTQGSPSTHPLTPVVPSNASLQSTGPVNAGPNQASWYQSTPAPDPTGSWQFVSHQQAQPVRMVSVGSPNPAVYAMSSRQPNVSGQRAYAHTPSPTMMQNLSMQSPVQQGFQWPQPVRGNSSQIQSNQTAPGYTTINHNEMAYPGPEQNGVQQQQLAARQIVWQQQQALQYQQMQQTTPHRVVSNHVGQMRRDSNSVVDPRQRIRCRNNSDSSTGRRTPNRPPSNAQIPVPAVTIATGARSGTAVQQNAIQIYAQTHPFHRQLIPPLGFVQPSQPVAPELTALHQARSRSPRLVPADFPADPAGDDSSRRFYQTVKDFALGPIKIPVTAALSKFEFGISDATFALVARDKYPGATQPAADQLATREFRRGTLQFRLRCIQTKRDVTKCLTPDWVVSDTVWPEAVFLEVNGETLEVRRKNHHGKDLPIDITRFVLPSNVLPSGFNSIKLSTPRLRKDRKDLCYFIAVETVEILQHRQIMDVCLQQKRVPAAETLNAIRKSLAGPVDDDEDLAMVVSDLSIDVADPFTARIFVVPVKGSSCLHRECFDLETFLLTRNSKPKRPQQPSMVDVWKCPLCGKDARPYSLRVDDFLASVRAELAKQGNLDVKAILISADGKWRPKPEPQPLKRKASNDPNDDDDDDDDDSSDDESIRKEKVLEAANRAMEASNSKKKDIEVIELDDD